jgi:hypothetical protein
LLGKIKIREVEIRVEFAPARLAPLRRTLEEASELKEHGYLVVTAKLRKLKIVEIS